MSQAELLRTENRTAVFVWQTSPGAKKEISTVEIIRLSASIFGICSCSIPPAD
jgi:hypothetical protein